MTSTMPFISLDSGSHFLRLGSYSCSTLQKVVTHTLLSKILDSRVLYHFIDVCDSPEEV